MKRHWLLQINDYLLWTLAMIGAFTVAKYMAGTQ